MNGVEYLKTCCNLSLLWNIEKRGRKEKTNFLLFSFPYQREEVIRLVVDYQFVGKICLFQKWNNKMVVAYERGVVGIAGKNYWNVMAFAQVQHIGEKSTCKRLAAIGVQRTIVEFEQGAGAFGGKHNGLNVKG